MNGVMEHMLPIKLRGDGYIGQGRSGRTRTVDVIGPHKLTKSWLEQIPNRSGQPYVMRFPNAVSTATQTRMSVVGLDLSFLRTLPPPDGTIGQADRQHVSWKYTGILAGGGAPAATSTAVLLNMTARGLGWGLSSGLG